MQIGYRKDGGPNSHVGGWFFEIKSLFTIALLKFSPGTREAFHEHAFNSISLILGIGFLRETFQSGFSRWHFPGDFLITRTTDFHQVSSEGTTYVLTLRGPWKSTWREVDENNESHTLTHGRKKV